MPPERQRPAATGLRIAHMRLMVDEAIRRWTRRLLIAVAVVAMAGASVAIADPGAIVRVLGWRIIRLNDPWRPAALASASMAAALLLSRAFRDAVTRRSERPGRLVAWLVLLCALTLPVARVGMKQLADGLPDSYPASDGAVLSLYAVRASEGHLLLGPYSRFGWHHPGPMLFYLLAPAYSATGYHEASHKFMALILNLVAIAGALSVARLCGGGKVALALAIVLGLVVWRTPDLIVSPWNPHIIVLPLVCVIVLTAGVLAGRTSLLPLAALSGTFVAQSHIGLVPVVTVLLLASGVVTLRARFRSDHTVARAAGRTLNATAWLLAIAWFPPLAEQMANSPGNVTRVATFFTAPPPAPGVSLRLALSVVGQHLLPPASVMELAAGDRVFSEPGSILAVVVAVTMVSLLVASGVLAYRGHRFVSSLAATCAVTLVVSVWSVSHIVGRVVNHLVYWTIAPGMVGLAVLASFLLEPVVRLVGRRRHAGAALAAAFFIAVVPLGMRSAFHSQRREARDTRVRDLFLAMEQHERKVEIVWPVLASGPGTWAEAACLLLQHVKAGRRISSEDRLLDVVGDWFRPTGREDGCLMLMRRQDFERFPRRNDVVVVIAESGLVLVDASGLQPGGACTSRALR